MPLHDSFELRPPQSRNVLQVCVVKALATARLGSGCTHTLITMSTLYFTLQSFFVSFASKSVTSFSVSSILVCVISVKQPVYQYAAVVLQCTCQLKTHYSLAISLYR